MRLVVGITGASGSIYGVRLLQHLGQVPGVEVHLVVSEAAAAVLREEAALSLEQVHALAHVVYDNHDLTAPISSGSFPTDGMVVAPCSIKTLSALANSYCADLISRAGDVALKERRPLVLLVRETPLHSGHLEQMLKLARMGAVILPPVPAFYHRPASIEDIVDHSLGKVLDQLRIPHTLFRRWRGAPATSS